MNWEAIGAIGEIAGALAVVVTLLLLSRQLKDTSRQLSLASTTDANTLYSDAFWPIYNSEFNLRVWTHGLRDPESLSDEELEVFKLFMTRLMAVFDSVVDHYDQGTFSEERFENYRKFTTQFLESPGGKVWLASEQFLFTESAQKILGLHQGAT